MPGWVEEAPDLDDWSGAQGALAVDLLLPDWAVPFFGGEDDPAVAGTCEPLPPSVGKVKLKRPHM